MATAAAAAVCSLTHMFERVNEWQKARKRTISVQVEWVKIIRNEFSGNRIQNHSSDFHSRFACCVSNVYNFYCFSFHLVSSSSFVFFEFHCIERAQIPNEKKKIFQFFFTNKKQKSQVTTVTKIKWSTNIRFFLKFWKEKKRKTLLIDDGVR